MTANTLPARSDVPVEETFNKEALFKDWDDWRNTFAEAQAALPVLQSFAGRLSEGPGTLLAWFEANAALNKRMFHVGVYVAMLSAVDTSDAEVKAASGQLGGLYSQEAAAVSFAVPELQSIGEKLLEWCQDEPLAKYRHYFEHLLLQKEHTRSPEVEAILGLVDEPLSSVYDIYSELTETDLKFSDAVDSSGTPHLVAQATVSPTGIQSTDRDHRRTAWQSFFDGYLTFKNTLAASYITNLKSSVFTARARNYHTVLESRLAPTGLPTKVFHTLIDTFKASLGTWHRYWEVKRKILGVEELHPYDIWAPIVSQPPVISYQQAVNWLCEAMAPLGDRYTTPLRRGCNEERWVDYAQNIGKRQGAFSTPAFDSPPFIFTSYDNTLMAMSILSHELGHSMHSYLSSQVQPPIYRGYSMLSSTVAETASNFNQAMLRAFLLEACKDDPAFQIALIDEAMFNFHRYFFQMPTLARFEFEAYSRQEQGKPLNTGILLGIMKDLYAEGYGQTLADEPERTSITWATFPHLYQPFYTFQYAVGISAAHALSDRVLHHNGADDYIAFLTAGASMYPLDVFRLGGIDMSTPEPVERTFAILGNYVERLEGLVSKNTIGPGS